MAKMGKFRIWPQHLIQLGLFSERERKQPGRIFVFIFPVKKGLLFLTGPAVFFLIIYFFPLGRHSDPFFLFMEFSPRHLSWWTFLLFSLVGFVFFYGFYRFLLDRRANRSEAQRWREIDAFKTRFYTHFTHEFRTPLTIIGGLADQVLSNDREKRLAAVQLIKRNSNHLLRLINQMLDLAKLESGKLAVQMVQSDIVRFLKYCLESFYSWAESKQIEFHFQAEPEVIQMDFDPAKIQNIVSNLLSNALKATLPGGRILFNIRINQGQLCCSIEDTGTGIAAENLPFIFDRFFKATPEFQLNKEFSSASFVGAYEGAGIGLALTRELLELMDGRIDVWSESGKGSRFTFFLPIQRTAGWEPVPEEHFGHLPADLKPILYPVIQQTADIGNRPRLLIIEDHTDAVYFLQSILGSRYNLQVALDGQTGIDLALRDVPDIILSDVMIPQRGGLEVCRILKADERTSHIPIVLLTARAAMEDKIRGIRFGADAYLSKPFHKDELIALLEQLLSQRLRLKQYFRQQDARHQEAEKSEAAFLQKVRSCILDHVDDEGFGVGELAEALFLSRTQLFRKLKALTSRNVATFIHQVRIDQAKNLLASTDLTISEIAFSTGFSDPSYLRRVFFKETGETLADYRNKLRSKPSDKT